MVVGGEEGGGLDGVFEGWWDEGGDWVWIGFLAGGGMGEGKGGRWRLFGWGFGCRDGFEWRDGLEERVMVGAMVLSCGIGDCGVEHELLSMAY